MLAGGTVGIGVHVYTFGVIAPSYSPIGRTLELKPHLEHRPFDSNGFPPLCPHHPSQPQLNAGIVSPPECC